MGPQARGAAALGRCHKEATLYKIYRSEHLLTQPSLPSSAAGVWVKNVTGHDATSSRHETWYQLVTPRSNLAFGAKLTSELTKLN